MKTVAFIRSTGIYNDSRATKEIFALVAAGYKVVVLGWNRDGKSVDQSRAVFSSVNESVSLFFYDRSLPNGSGMKGIAQYLFWFLWIRKMLISLSKIDYVHACDFDTGFAVYAMCAKRNIKFVYDVYDYYVDAHILPSCLSGIVEWCEIKVINSADVVVICTEERREQIAKASPRRVEIIYNSPDISQEYSYNENTDYTYCGVLNDQRLVGEIFENYGQNSDISFVFAGYGRYESKARKLQKTYENFMFLESIPYSKVLELEAQTKVLAAIYEPTIRNHRLCAPNKFYEALALGKPVIVCKGTGIDKIVESNNIGICIDYDAEQFYAALRRLIASPDERREMGIRARKLYDEKYSWEKMKKVLSEFYSEI